MLKFSKLVLGILLLIGCNNANASMKENNNFPNNNNSINENVLNIDSLIDKISARVKPFESLSVIVNTLNAIVECNKYPIDNVAVDRCLNKNYDKRNASKLIDPLRDKISQDPTLGVLYEFKDYRTHRREILSHYIRTTFKDYLKHANNANDDTDNKIVETVFKHLTYIVKIENDKLSKMINNVRYLSDNTKCVIYNYILQNFEGELSILANYYTEILTLISKHNDVIVYAQAVTGQAYEFTEMEYGFQILFGNNKGILQYLNNLNTFLALLKHASDSINK